MVPGQWPRQMSAAADELLSEGTGGAGWLAIPGFRAGAVAATSALARTSPAHNPDGGVPLSIAPLPCVIPLHTFGCQGGHHGIMGASSYTY